MKINRLFGFSLIELLLVISILGIIVGVALPAWRSQVLATRRIDAMAALLHLAAQQERFRMQHQRYANAGELALAPPNGLGIASTQAGYYSLSLVATADDFAASATVRPDGAQSNDSDCWIFTIDAQGSRWARGADGIERARKCWGN